MGLPSSEILRSCECQLTAKLASSYAEGFHKIDEPGFLARSVKRTNFSLLERVNEKRNFCRNNRCNLSLFCFVRTFQTSHQSSPGFLAFFIELFLYNMIVCNTTRKFQTGYVTTHLPASSSEKTFSELIVLSDFVLHSRNSSFKLQSCLCLNFVADRAMFVFTKMQNEEDETNADLHVRVRR